MLWIALVFVFIIAIMPALVLLFKNSIENKSSKSCSFYKKRDRVMNDSEQALYIKLQKNLGDKFIVLSKVRIEDFIEVPERNLEKRIRWGLRGRIKSRHVDFLICDKTTTKPLLAVELDGGSHNDYCRSERDNFVNKLYESVGLPIEHIDLGNDFQKETLELRNFLLSGLRKH